MKKYFSFLLFMTAAVLFGAGCNKPQQPVNQAPEQAQQQTNATSTDSDRMAQETALANPASVNCLDRGGKLSLQKTLDGSTEGICILPNNIICEEWALFRGECGPKATTSTGMTQATSTTATASSTLLGEKEQGMNAIVPDKKIELEVEQGEEPGEIINRWSTGNLNTDDGFIIMLSGNENISYPMKYMQVVKNPKSKSFTWTNLVAGRKYYFLLCIADGDKCGTQYSQVASETAQ